MSSYMLSIPKHHGLQHTRVINQYRKDGVHSAEYKTILMVTDLRTKPGVALLCTEVSPLTNP